MKVTCGKIPAAATSIIKDFLDLSLDLIKRELKIFSDKKYISRLKDAIRDLDADFACIDSNSIKECECCCNNYKI